jgi:hypothetical protein
VNGKAFFGNEIVVWCPTEEIWDLTVKEIMKLSGENNYRSFPAKYGTSSCLRWTLSPFDFGHASYDYYVGSRFPNPVSYVEFFKKLKIVVNDITFMFPERSVRK